jgi:hypothetical protein
MPKERLHLLLADQSLQILSSSGDISTFNETQKFAYFLGAISPDALFYDLPSFRHSPLGNALHRMEGRRCLTFLEPIFKERSKNLTPETAAWLLGVANHFWVDGYWHPFIEKMSDPDSSLCRQYEFTERQCHYWLESEHEGYWLARIGPLDGYLPLLKQFAGMNNTRENCIKAFRMILTRMGLDQIPSEKEIGRCLFWQAVLLHQFSLPAWAKRRNLLLKIGPTRVIGALIVPASPCLSDLAAAKHHQNEELDNLCSDWFLAHSVLSLTTSLRSLARQL